MNTATAAQNNTFQRTHTINDNLLTNSIPNPQLRSALGRLHPQVDINRRSSTSTNPSSTPRTARSCTSNTASRQSTETGWSHDKRALQKAYYSDEPDTEKHCTSMYTHHHLTLQTVLATPTRRRQGHGCHVDQMITMSITVPLSRSRPSGSMYSKLAEEQNHMGKKRKQEQKTKKIASDTSHQRTIIYRVRITSHLLRERTS